MGHHGAPAILANYPPNALVTTASVPPPHASPDPLAMLAVSLASVGDAIALGGILLAVVIGVTSIGWGFFFRSVAKNSARESALSYLRSRDGQELIRAATLGDLSRGLAAPPSEVQVAPTMPPDAGRAKPPISSRVRGALRGFKTGLSEDES